MANIVDDNMYNQLKQLYWGDAGKASKYKAQIESTYTTDQYNSLVANLNKLYWGSSSNNNIYTDTTTSKLTDPNINKPSNTYWDVWGAANASKYTWYGVSSAWDYTYNSNLTIPSGSEGSYNLTAVWWDYVYNDVLYEYNGETLCVAGYIGNLQTDIFIPREIFGKTVIGIKAGAFDGLEKKAIPYGYISRIIIPRTISYIGENAFNDCKNIRVTLQINYDDEATLEVISWLQSVEISPIGNDDLVDVLTFKRPAIGFTQYKDIVE